MSYIQWLVDWGTETSRLRLPNALAAKPSGHITCKPKTGSLVLQVWQQTVPFIKYMHLVRQIIHFSVILRSNVLGCSKLQQNGTF